MNTSNPEILQQLRSLLYYHNACGINKYPISEELKHFLKTEISSFFPEIAGRHSDHIDSTSEQLSEPSMPRQERNSLETLEEIAEEVRTCRSCRLHMNRIVPVPGFGGHHVKLLIVGGWLLAEGGENAKRIAFGAEEDLMIARMVKAIDLLPDQTFVTNIIKCGIGKSVQPTVENIDACHSYLERQIGVISPDIICTMGIAATRTLLKIGQPLSQLRGRIHQYRQGNRHSIPLVPTYHPTFLLKNPEMKKATWADLQLIAKQLRG